MDNPSCTSTPPETILSLLWTTVAVFGIVYAILGYRCLRAIGFLSGLAAGTGCILWLQSQQVELIGNQADSGKNNKKKYGDIDNCFYNWNGKVLNWFFFYFHFHWPKIALAMIAGLFGAILGSTHPIAAVLVCAFAGAITSGSIIAICIATLPHYIFGVSAHYHYYYLKHAKLKLKTLQLILIVFKLIYSCEKLLLLLVVELLYLL